MATAEMPMSAEPAAISSTSPFFRTHIPALDGVRGLAILLVMTFHFFQMRSVNLGRHGKFWWHVACAGQTGVDLFFVLSGFLITGILLDTKGDEHGLRNFYMRRTLRIFPLYYAVLLGLFVILPLLGIKKAVPWDTQWWYWTYSQDVGFTFLSPPLPGPNHFWSLAVEEHFYWIWPFLVYYLQPRRLLTVLAGLLAGSLAIRALLFIHHFEIFYFTCGRLDGLLVGSAVAVWVRQPRGLDRLRTAIGPVIPAYLAATAILYFTFAASHVAALHVVKYTGIALVHGAFLVLAISARTGSWLYNLLSRNPLRWIGKYSYSMYIFHPYIFAFINPHWMLSHPQAFVLEWGMTFLIAWCTWRLWENPFLRLKSRFS